MKKIKLTEKQFNRVILNEGLFSRKKKIKSFQDYNDYINDINTTVTLYEKGDNFLVTRRGDYDEYVIKTFSKDDYSVEDVLNIVSDMTNEDKFRTEPEHFTYNKKIDIYIQGSNVEMMLKEIHIMSRLCEIKIKVKIELNDGNIIYLKDDFRSF